MEESRRRQKKLVLDKTVREGLLEETAFELRWERSEEVREEHSRQRKQQMQSLCYSLDLECPPEPYVLKA